MTAINTELTDLTDLDWAFVPPCESEFNASDCPNEADYVIGLECCMVKLLFCTDCLDEWNRWASYRQGFPAKCAHCKESFLVHPNHVKVLSRLDKGGSGRVE